MRTAKWAVVLDFDGTLIPPSYGSLYDVIDTHGMSRTYHCRAERMRKHYLAKALESGLTRAEQKQWFADTVALYADAGLTMRTINRTLANIRFRDGVSACLMDLRSRGIPVAIVSYGIAQFIRAALVWQGLEMLIDKVYSTRLTFDAHGKVVGFDPKTSVYPFNKGAFSRRFADVHGVPYRNILAVGDSPSGDRLLGHLKENRFGLARTEEGRKKLLEVMGDVAIDAQSFAPATEWLLEKVSSR
ncbi:haloacid dehalogenase-like hydrolase [Patescibacteria group bacterium]|nr:haloacid dehalogenase-like hydrolase [Patescibacteria group bacterium]